MLSKVRIHNIRVPVHSLIRVFVHIVLIFVNGIIIITPDSFSVYRKLTHLLLIKSIPLFSL